MLTKKERHQVIAFLGFFSHVNLFPIQVDPDGWDIRPGCKNNRKAWACKLAYGIYIAQTLYKSLSLLYVFLFLHDIPLHHNVIHGVVATASVIFVFWQYELFWKNVNVSTEFLKVSLSGIGAGATASTMVKTDDKGSWLGRMREKSLQDLVAIFLPYIALVTIPVMGASYALDPTMKLLVYSVLPASCQNWLSFGICLVEEIRIVGVFAGTVVPVLQAQIIAFDLTSDSLQCLIESMTTPRSRRASNTEALYMRLRCLQLYITQLNVVNRHLIFTWKVLAVGICIVSGYAAIAHFKEHPVFGVMYYAMFFDAALVYTLLYEKAFKVPVLFQRAKSLLRLIGSGLRNRAERKMLDRRALSIRSAGIKVGEFHAMERTSTPLFLHYVLNNVVSMLVAYA